MPEPLYYAPFNRDRQFARRLIGWLIVVVASGYLILLFHDVPSRIRLMWEQSGFVSYTIPANQVVYSDAWAPPHYSVTQSEAIGAWDAFSDSPNRNSATVFIHQRQMPGNPKRIVGVTCLARLGSRITFKVAVMECGSIRQRPRLLKLEDLWISMDGANVTIFGGQPDPDDGRHFTIRYECGGRPGIIDGWLEADDTVKLEPRQ
jgi:hypothetical protein